MDSTEENINGLAAMSLDHDLSDDQNSSMELEKVEEQKLMSKYPNGISSGHSIFLQKRLQKRNKFFDSGDYQMAKQIGIQPIFAAQMITGDKIPTPETVPVRKHSIIQPYKNPLKKCDLGPAEDH